MWQKIRGPKGSCCWIFSFLLLFVIGAYALETAYIVLGARYHDGSWVKVGHEAAGWVMEFNNQVMGDGPTWQMISAIRIAMCAKRCDALEPVSQRHPSSGGGRPLMRAISERPLPARRTESRPW